MGQKVPDPHPLENIAPMKDSPHPPTKISEKLSPQKITTSEFFNPL